MCIAISFIRETGLFHNHGDHINSYVVYVTFINKRRVFTPSS